MKNSKEEFSNENLLGHLFQSVGNVLEENVRELPKFTAFS